MTTSTATERHITLQCQFCQSWNRIDAARAADRPKCGKCSRPILIDRPYTVSDETFARTIEGSDVPVMVDFYADWCAPCKQMAPAIDAVAGKYQGRVLVTKLNTDTSPATAAQYGIRGIPTTIVFANGKEVARETGAIPQAAIEALLTRAPGVAP
jgi:thioredoxin 2